MSESQDFKDSKGGEKLEDVFKVVLIGDALVGKTSLVLRYTEDRFRTNLMSTIGVDLKVKNVISDGKKYVIKIWDTAGQERFNSIRGTFFRGANGAVIVYDITSPKSFTAVPKWLEHLKASSPDDMPVTMLLGNKADMTSERKVNRLKADELALCHKVKNFEVSAKSGDFVDRAFESFVADLISASKNKKELIGGRRMSNRVQLESTSQSGSSEHKKCCS